MVDSIPLTFFRGDTPLAGRLYRNTTRWDVRQPAVIVTGSWLTVKEQKRTASRVGADPGHLRRRAQPLPARRRLSTGPLGASAADTRADERHVILRRRDPYSHPSLSRCGRALVAGGNNAQLSA